MLNAKIGLAIVNNPRNPYKGKIFNNPTERRDVYAGVEVWLEQTTNKLMINNYIPKYEYINERARK